MNRAERRRAEREQAKLDRTLSKRKAEADELGPGLLEQLREMRVGAVERGWPSVVVKLDEAIAAFERGAGKRAQVLVYEAAAEVARLREDSSAGGVPAGDETTGGDDAVAKNQGSTPVVDF